jgi:hypothetical protein
MIKEPNIINLEKTLEILDILKDYIDDNNEIKPEFFERLDLLTKCLSIFSGVTIEQVNVESIFDVVLSFDDYVKVNEILEANKITKNLGLR